jgi:hypothetical protein
MLHRIALPVVSEWYQQRHSFFTILLTRARIRSTLSTSLTTPPYSLPSTLLALDALYGPQHRRRNGSGIGPSVLSWRALRRRERFRVGEVTFEYRGPRSVCRYIERLTEPGMTQALKGRGGVCARVIENGKVRVVGEIDLL